MSKQTIIQQIVDSGMIDKTEATTKVEKLFEYFEKSLAKDTYESEKLWKADVEKQVMKSVSRYIRMITSENITGLCVGFSDLTDANEISRRVALKMYKDDPKRAVKEGFVQVDGKEIIPLDNKEYFDPDTKKMKNSNFGKPFKVKMQREILFIVDDTIVRAFGTVTPVVGHVYTVYGKYSKGGSFTIDKKLGIVDTNSHPESLWNAIIDICGDSNDRVDLENLADTQKNKFIVTLGELAHAQETSNGGMIVLKNEQVTKGIIGFVSSEEIVNSIVNITGDNPNVIVFGKTISLTDRETGMPTIGLNVLGVIVDPDSVMDETVVTDIDSILLG